ncbi:MAG TPA: DsrE family protein [Symbiobacteriaceae bacterium]|nr:DsrE family protein [Symbiobacteriaceae bacterium]
MQPSICVLITQAPYGLVHAAEGVRHVNGALSQGFSASALLTDDGVWLACKGQNAGQTGYTSLSEALEAALNKQDGPKPRVLVHGQSLAERGLTAADLIDGIELTDDAGLAALLAESQYLLRF